MPSITVKNAISDLKGLKTIAADKADKASSSRVDQQIQASQIKAAESRITQAEASVTRYEQQKDKAEDKLSPPPTKTIPSDGKKGGSKTVVDEREKDKLQAQVRAADLQIQQAQAAVEAAREEADELKGNILVSAGLTEEQANDMGSLQSQIDELTALANDEQTDLTSDDYQRQTSISK
jgi:chromosome segregation ATPase